MNKSMIKMKFRIGSFLFKIKLKMLKLLTSREMFFAELVNLGTRRNKIHVIKEVRNLTGLNLKESKELVERMHELLLEFNKGVA